MPAADYILDFSEKPASIRIRNECLAIEQEGELVGIVRPADVAVVMLSQPRLSISQPALAALSAAGASIVVCDERHTPVGMMLPLAAHWAHAERLAAQVTATKPTRKRLWQQCVRAKIRAQGATLALLRGDDAGLPIMARRVRSGDPDNLEATAAQRYWPRVFGDPGFRRRRDAPDQNRMLNYGYAVMRAAVARSVCAAGLHPALALHHHSRTNAFALADDLVEPYRTLVDEEVAEQVSAVGADAPLDGRVREALAGVLHARLHHDGEDRVVLDHIQRTADSLASALLGERPDLHFPSGLFDA